MGIHTCVSISTQVHWHPRTRGYRCRHFCTQLCPQFFAQLCPQLPNAQSGVLRPKATFAHSVAPQPHNTQGDSRAQRTSPPQHCAQLCPRSAPIVAPSFAMPRGVIRTQKVPATLSAAPSVPSLPSALPPASLCPGGSLPVPSWMLAPKLPLPPTLPHALRLAPETSMVAQPFPQFPKYFIVCPELPTYCSKFQCILTSAQVST